MNELYWITRLDAINVLLAVFLLISIAVFVTHLIGFLSKGGDIDEYFTKKDFRVLKTSFFYLHYYLLQ